MLALVGTVMLRSASGKVLLRDGDGVLGTHTVDHRERVSAFRSTATGWRMIGTGGTRAKLRPVCRHGRGGDEDYLLI